MVVCPGEKALETKPGTEQKSRVSKGFSQSWGDGSACEMLAVQEEDMSLIPQNPYLKKKTKTSGCGGTCYNARVGEVETGESSGLTGQPVYPSQWSLRSP